MTRQNVLLCLVSFFVAFATPAWAGNAFLITGDSTGTVPFINAGRSNGTTDATALGFQVNGAEVMRVTANEKVGIGTTGPYYNLHLNGGQLGVTTTDFNNTTRTGSSIFLGLGATTGSTYGVLEATLAGGNNAGGSLVLNPYGGNVGIGTTTPIWQLTAESSSYVSGSHVGRSLPLDLFPRGLELLPLLVPLLDPAVEFPALGLLTLPLGLHSGGAEVDRCFLIAPLFLKSPVIYADVMAACAQARACLSLPYLTSRGLGPDVLGLPIFAGCIRVDARNNALFPHYDREGLCGFEVKNLNFTGFAPGGVKGLWYSRAKTTDARLVLTESAIDAMSFHVLQGDAWTRYMFLIVLLVAQNT